MKQRSMSRRAFLASGSAGLIGAALATPGCATRNHAAGADPRPNFVVVLCDDLGYGDLGCFGHPRIATPHLDALAGAGTRLTSCYASAPVCSPSRGGMLTGRTPHRLGIFDWIPPGSAMHLHAGEITVARVLQDAGYATCFTGKWHCNGKFNSPDQPQPDAHGFAHWFATQNNAHPTHHNPDNFVRNGEPLGRLAGYSSTLIVDEALDWLAHGWDRRQPFCLFVWFHSPHEPVATAAEFTAPYRDAETAEQAEYFGNVTQMDHEAGRLLAGLDGAGVRGNTLVYFTSDNGPETLRRYRGAERSYGSPGALRGMKLHLYEGGIRVPGMLHWPGHTTPGSVWAEPVCGLDVLPTLCAAAGAAPPSGRAIDGASFLPMLEGQPIRRTTPLYWRYDRALSAPYTVALRDGRWKLLADEALTRFELYDLAEDAGEQRNLAVDSPAVLEALTAKLRPLHAGVAAEGAAYA